MKELTARYVEFKRFAVHDGPGIRTTLFLKGCPLACVWCHNPETISAKPELAIHDSRCVRCGECAAFCPCHSIVGGEHRFDRKNCTGCGKCVEHCLYDALELYGREISVEEAARILLEDRAFYAGGGGVTVSGGEPLLQSGFCAELFARLKRDGIHCAIDTCGHVEWEAFRRVLPVTDLFLYDFKAADPEKHRALTGQDNERILANLRRLDETGKPIEIRMIQVPGLNMERSDLEQAAAFLSRLRHLTAVRLLACHHLAHAKYEAVGRKDTQPRVEMPGHAELEFSAAILRRAGLNVLLP